MIKNSCYYCVYKNFCWIGRVDITNQKNITCHGFIKKEKKEC
jgi:hypothetical protein